MLPQYNGQQSLAIKSVWFYNGTGGSLTLVEGQAVCYDLDDTNAPATNTADPKNARGNRVVKPATAVLGAFAGLISAGSAGKVIPDASGAFIDIVVPRRGDVVTAMTKVNGTKGATGVGITNAGGFNLVAFTDATLNLDLVGVVFETVDTSTTAAAKLVKFL
jgi:hypothetical protein